MGATRQRTLGVSVVKVSCSLHELTADDLRFATVNGDGTVAAIDSSTGVQLHWRSLEEFDAWIDRLHGQVYAKVHVVKVPA